MEFLFLFLFQPSNFIGCSEVIKGLVFKKNAAHKHMPTSCHSPRLLLLKGVLGHSDVGLSSFNSMDQVRIHIFICAQNGELVLY